MSLNPLSVLKVARELRRSSAVVLPLGVAGARELVPLLARELRAGGRSSAVVEQRTEGLAALIWLGEPDEDRPVFESVRDPLAKRYYGRAPGPQATGREPDQAGLPLSGVFLLSPRGAASRADVPIVAVTDAETVPYVLAEDLVRVPAGQGFPLAEITAAVAGRLGEKGATLAAALPVLRPAVCRNLIGAYAKRNALIAAAVFIPGVDLPVLTLNQVRLVLWIAIAHGEELDRQRAAELIGVVGAGFGFRAAARELLDLVPVAGWAVKGAVAYTGTRAVGEAAMRYFEARG